MQHSQHMVAILNEHGKVVGQKRRQDINKTKDIYHTVMVLLITPRSELVLSVIPARHDLPNMYAHQMSTTVATILRSQETTLQAAKRGVKNELFISNAPLKLLGNQMLSLPNTSPTFATVYYIQADMPTTYNATDINSLKLVSPQQLQSLILKHPSKIAPTLQLIWDRFGRGLPL